MNEPKERGLAAIMFTDMVGYTALMQENEALALVRRKRHREVLVAAHAKFRGKIIQYFGDGTLSVFDSIVEAVRCGIEIQTLLKEEPKVPLRIGIHTGDIVYNDDEIIGDGVNLASRLESMAVPGAILVSGKVVDDLDNHPDIITTSVGIFELKNVSKPMELFLLILDNFEQIIDAASDVLELLQRCPNLKIIISSRIVLLIQGEQEYPVPPLVLPDIKGSIDIDRFKQYPSIRLFVERARTVQPRLEECVANLRRIDAKPELVVSLNHLGYSAYLVAEYQESAKLSQEALAIGQDLDLKRVISTSHNNLGFSAALEGQLELAHANFSKGASIRKNIGDRRGYAFVLVNLAPPVFGWLNRASVISRSTPSVTAPSLIPLRNIGPKFPVVPDWLSTYGRTVAATVRMPTKSCVILPGSPC